MKNHSTSTATPSASPELSKVPAGKEQKETWISRTINDLRTHTKGLVNAVLENDVLDVTKAAVGSALLTPICPIFAPIALFASVGVAALSLEAIMDYEIDRKREKEKKKVDTAK